MRCLNCGKNGIPLKTEICPECGVYIPALPSPSTSPSPTVLDCGNGVTLELVSIPAGSFMMGSDKGGDDEKPVHKVTINYSFLMGKYPVTQAQYQAVMGNNPSYFQGDNRPVERVTWHEAREFCNRLSAKTGKKVRLPSEAEWEYACRSGTTTEYYFGDDASKLNEYAWYEDNSNGETHPVGQKKPNQWGLYDMHGNVWEWCQDEWHSNYNGAPNDGSAWEIKGNENDNRWRVIRGGSLYLGKFWSRAASRNDGNAHHRNLIKGFTVVVSY